MSNTQDNKPNNVILDDEKHLVLDHDYDGIEELNHPLPNWWVGIWAISFVFAVLYMMFYWMLDGPSLKDEYHKEMAKVELLIEAESKNVANFSAEQFKTWTTEEGIAKGAEIYEENCLSCHAELGGGDIGPNLTDKHWLRIKKFDAAEIYPFIVKGNEDEGMPAWGEVLDKQEIMAVTAYVMTLNGKKAPESKEPQGELLDY